MKPQSGPLDSRLTVAEPGLENGRAAAGVPETTTDISVSTSTGSSAGQAAVNDADKDLTVFFAIGVIVDVLLVAAFLVWAVGQWRKTKK